MKVLIVGYGTVGKNLQKEIFALNPEIYDKYTSIDTRKHEWTTVNDKIAKIDYYYDIAFICVDTPLTETEGYKSLDTTEVANAINEHNASIYVIKSTMPMLMTSMMQIHSGKHIVYSPEYYGATAHCNNFDFNFTILGGDKCDCIKVQQALQNCYDARHTFHITDTKTAELAKLMENTWIATKVSFCNQFYELAESFNLNYEELRELFILDPRVNPSHTFVYRDHPYWDTHCLNKDVPYIADNENAQLLKSIIEFNNKQKDKYKNDK